MRVCIITTAHLSNNPRVVKEADALHEAGHDVRVIGWNRWPEFATQDRELMSHRRWRWIGVPIGPDSHRVRYLVNGAIGKAAERAFARGLRSPAIRDRAINKHHAALTRAACAEPSDLVIAHHAPALPAAARAASRLGARFGFDAEDLHAEDFPNAAGAERERALITSVERAYLTRCDVITASSEPIANELLRRYRIVKPEVVLNVFPEEDRLRPAEELLRDATLPSLYWFSMVIGANRGIEDALAAVALLSRRVEVHLRGTLDQSYAPRLEQLIARYGLVDRVHVAPRARPADLVALAAHHDIGLALEQPVSMNRDLCLTNKLFVYMLAGLAVAATDTRGQRSILEQVPDAGFLYRPGDAASLAAGIGALLESPERLARAKRAAAEAAQRRYVWDVEKHRLVSHLTHADAVSAPSTVPAAARPSLR